MRMSARKLRRELKRPLDQARALLQAPWEAWVRRRHDRDFHRRVRITEGAVPPGPKAAVFLIFQPQGIAASTRLTCAHLAAHGYATILTSNLPLSDADRAALNPLVWRIVERPNLGYDFGGYRDGLRIARETLPDLASVIVMNDSIWWPVFPGDRTLDDLDASEADVTGLFRTPFRDRRRTRPRPPFIHSYFYRFGPGALKSPAFWRFWQGYRLSSFKFNAIRRGEMRLTGAMAEAGLTVGALYRFEDLLDLLGDADTATLERTLRYFAPKDAGEEAAITALLAAPEDGGWQARARAFLARADAHREFQLALAHPLHDLVGMNSMKKTAGYPPHALHHRVRERFLAAVRAGDLPAPNPEVLAEIEATHRASPAYVAP